MSDVTSNAASTELTCRVIGTARHALLSTHCCDWLTAQPIEVHCWRQLPEILSPSNMCILRRFNLCAAFELHTPPPPRYAIV